MSDTAKFTTAADAKAFILGGNATVTLVSLVTEVRFTYKIRASDDRQVFFVSLLNGPDNENSYKYLGRISRDIFHAGRKTPKPGDISADAPSAQAFAFIWKALMMREEIPQRVEIWHEGRCGRCNRKLTVPASIASGFGPECSERIGVAQLARDYNCTGDGVF